MLGLMLTGTEFALRGVDAAARSFRAHCVAARPRTGRDWRPLGMLLAGVGADHAVLAGEAAVAAGAGIRGDGAGLPLGRHVKALCWRADRCTAVSVAVMALIGWASGLGLRLALHPGHRQRGAQLDVAADAAGPGHRAGRHPARTGRSHHRRAGLTRAIGVMIITMLVTWLLLAVLRGRLHPVGGLGVALGIDRAAVPRRAALVPAVGDHPAGRVGDPARLPQHDHRGHPRRRHLRPDRQRRPLRAVPDPADATAGQRRDRGSAHRVDLHPSAVAHRADRTDATTPSPTSPSRAPATTGPPPPRRQPDAYAEST